MKQTLHCTSCNAILANVNLRRLEHVEILCAECGEWNVFDYDPIGFVFKEDYD